MTTDIAQLLLEAMQALDWDVHPGLAGELEAAAASLEAQEPVLEDPVLVPRGLIGAACCAIRGAHDAPKTLAELRRYTTGDLSHQPTSAVPDEFLEGAESFKSEMLAASNAMLHPLIEVVFAVWRLSKATPQHGGGEDE